jgi:hypothetical protein
MLEQFMAVAVDLATGAKEPPRLILRPAHHEDGIQLEQNYPSHSRSNDVKNPNYPDEQPKDSISEALTDRNADPAAQIQEAPLKVHGDQLLGSSGPQVERTGEPSDDGPPDGSRDEGF